MASDSTYHFFQRDFGSTDTKTPHAPVINTTRIVRRGGLRGGSVPPIHLGLRGPRAGSVPRGVSRPTPVIHTVATASHGASSIRRLSLAAPSASGSLAALPFAPLSGYQPRPVARRASIAAPGGSTISIWRVGRTTPTTSSSFRGLSEVTKGAAARPVYRPSSQAGFGRSSASVRVGVSPQVGLARSAGVGSSAGVPKPRQFYRRASISSFGGAGWDRDLPLGGALFPPPPPSVKALQRSSYASKGSTWNVPNKLSAEKVLSDNRINIKAKEFSSAWTVPVKRIDNDVHPRKKVDFERQLEDLLPLHQDSLAKLRARALQAKDHLSRHKILLDRYLPLQLGPDKDVTNEVESRYGELLSRMPQLDKRQKSRKVDDDFTTIIPPYKPASATSKGQKLYYDIANIPVSNSFTPKISDTRKRARSVLCKVKGDPHYFDF